MLIAFIQCLIKYFILESRGVQVALDDLHFVLLVIATIAIAAAGNIINDIYDVDTDTINRPNKVLIGRKISEKTAYQFFIILNIIGVGIGFYLSNYIGKPAFAAIFIIISGLLYMYASHLKGILLIGNIVVSILVAFSILIVGIFDIVPVLSANTRELQVLALQVILHYAGFAFVLNLIREIVKDIEDINGDKKAGMNTLPIAVGRKRTTTVVFVLAALLALIIIGYSYFYLYNSPATILYFLFFIVGPLIYFCIKTLSAENAKDFAVLSVLLKVIMFLGICSVLFYPIP